VSVVAGTAVDLGVEVGPLRLANPVIAAAGTFGVGREAARFVDPARLGAVVVKSLTRVPRAGRPGPRMVETAAGMLNAIGLQNPGVDAWLADDLPWLAARGVPLIVSVAGDSAADYGAVAARLAGAPGILALEANVSCPNVEDRGRVFARDPAATHAAVRAAVAAAGRPVFAKLTADVTDLPEVARAARDAGAAGVTLINTLLGLAIDADTARPVLGGVTGGLSGPAIKPVALRAVAEVATAVPDLPIIGCGGARSARDVVEFVMAGASAVAIGTASLADPRATVAALDALPGWLAARGHRRIADLRGAAL